MKEVLQDIYIGRQSMDSIEFKYDTIEVPLYKGEDREFQVFIKNFSSPTYITFLPDDSIKDYLILAPAKHQVQNNLYAKIVVRVPYNSLPVAEGMFYVVTGYGAQKKGFKLVVGLEGACSVDYEQIRSPKVSAPTVKTTNPPIASVPERVLVKSDEDDDVTKRTKKPPVFKVRDDWEDKREKTGPKKPKPSKSNTRYKQKSQKQDITLRQRFEAEKNAILLTVLLLAILAFLFFYIWYTDIESIFNFDQTFLLAIILIGFMVFVVLLIAVFFKTPQDSAD
ncbi:hypothetical protein [Methanolapillus ohkumae]|uniref:Uncharacterized protein n=1 Tax=Methanolapillus ohkumae TaxID=3028298 RepID=A0AA96VI68_9EURY|nr:hypothetical protein MsAm2_07110 [Methanosarcinaceae archaeon Am2]WNY26935.1 hypothetical protein MsAm2_07180 [Methanosarcinaceae archaeon Am2]WNY26942.1 hypothetical protein MsAm2_07250 [Methanosarcinaceae archaeon Am2]WNY26949.1 hypothetical protein MsAm2_07320 [Methanosarcinaceae archaeon Am2]WNY26956.1 hypothetical protein MsAm2_07390 [Methanosarcinaceae archaeon Am2]